MLGTNKNLNLQVQIDHALKENEVKYLKSMRAFIDVNVDGEKLLK